MVKEVPPVPPPGPLAAFAGAPGSTSAAVIVDGGIHARRRAGRAEHSHHLLPLLEELLAELHLSPDDLGAVAFARGPGPFTAGRIVVASAQGLGLGLGIPLLSVSSLGAVAWASGRERCAVALGAGRGEVYWGCFERREGGVAPLGEERVAAPADLVPPEGLTGGEAVWGVGDGWAEHGDELDAVLGPALAGREPAFEVTAYAVAALGAVEWAEGRTLAPEEAVPTYLRPSYAEKPG